MDRTKKPHDDLCIMNETQWPATNACFPWFVKMPPLSGLCSALGRTKALRRQINRGGGEPLERYASTLAQSLPVAVYLADSGAVPLPPR